MCVSGAFSEYAVVPVASAVKIDGGTVLDKTALIGCGVTTGFGSSVRTGEVKSGDSVVVMGAGGIGMNAVQCARIAGARYIVALDPVEHTTRYSKIVGIVQRGPAQTRRTDHDEISARGC